jgi:hypothetical protein
LSSKPEPDLSDADSLTLASFFRSWVAYSYSSSSSAASGSLNKPQLVFMSVITQCRQRFKWRSEMKKKDIEKTAKKMPMMQR